MLIASKQSFLNNSGKNTINGYLHFSNAYIVSPNITIDDSYTKFTFIFSYYEFGHDGANYLFKSRGGAGWYSFEETRSGEVCYFNMGSTTFLCSNQIKLSLNSWYILDFSTESKRLNGTISNFITNELLFSFNGSFSGTITGNSIGIVTNNSSKSYINLAKATGYKNNNIVFDLVASDKNSMYDNISERYITSPTGSTQYVSF